MIEAYFFVVMAALNTTVVGPFWDQQECERIRAVVVDHHSSSLARVKIPHCWRGPAGGHWK
jgi:hypothetical protein